LSVPDVIEPAAEAIVFTMHAPTVLAEAVAVVAPLAFEFADGAVDTLTADAVATPDPLTLEFADSPPLPLPSTVSNQSTVGSLLFSTLGTAAVQILRGEKGIAVLEEPRRTVSVLEEPRREVSVFEEVRRRVDVDV
jgi:hypothetical protein